MVRWTVVWKKWILGSSGSSMWRQTCCKSSDGQKVVVFAGFENCA